MELMLGNEAVARGAFEAGATVATAYPGTPSTEITEAAAKYDEIYCEWAPNEKVALEVALGASVGGARVMCSMKHVGLNVAADPLFTAAYSGVGGGLVVVVADDPGMHSSQNEQDSRFYARSAHIPMLEPADSAECLDYVKRAFALSEEYDTPVLLRLVTRIAHARSLVQTAPRQDVPLREYEKNPAKYVMMPAFAVARHVHVQAREEKLACDLAGMDLNRAEYRDEKVGVICSGAAYQYVREAMPEASTLKLGLVYPLDEARIREFAARVETLYVIEELEPFFEDAIKAMGIEVSGKDKTGLQGELFARKVGHAFAGEEDPGPALTPGIPGRPPVLCAGCPHRAVFLTLKKTGLTVMGDIGCYTLAALPPLSAMDTEICMGASIGMAMGMEKARGPQSAKNMVAVIGDSTFIHSGITGLVDMVYNGGHGTVLILDNSTTGMTGHQENPATGKTIKGDVTSALDLEALCRVVGVKSVRVVDPHDLKALETALKEETAREEVSVIIARRPCVLLTRTRQTPYVVDEEKCIRCGQCMKMGCPAIVLEGTAAIDGAVCVGCGLCADVCPVGAIGQSKGEGESGNG